MSIATFSGLASGVQWRELLEQISRAEAARRVTPLQQQAGAEQRRIDALNRYRGLVEQLATAAQALRDGDALGRLAVSTSGTGAGGRPLLGASATASASPGSHTVEVSRLARAHTLASAAFASDSTELGLAGSFTLNGVVIEVEPTDSLASLRDRVQGAGAGVGASVVRVADGSYRLAITSGTTGAAGIAYADADGVGAALGLETIAAGSDAEIVVDGLVLTRSTNVIADAIPGVTLSLQQAEPGTEVRVEIVRDEASALEAVRAFVSAYNAVRGFVDEQTSAGTQPLARSSLLRASLSAFRDVLLADAQVDGPLKRLALAGVSLGRTGRLELDEAKLKDVLATSRDDVAALLADVGARMRGAADAVARPVTGTIAGQVNALSQSVAALRRRADEAQLRVDRQLERLLDDFVRMEEALSRIQAQGDWLAGQVAALQPLKR